MNALKFPLILFTCLLVFFSCKKEEDHPIPEVNFIEPIENQIFNVLDTIHIQAEIHSEDPLTSLKVTLVNQLLSPVLPVYAISVNTPHSGLWNINQLIPIDAIQLESGNYFLWIAASTAFENKNKYLSVSLIGIPKRLEKILILSQTQPSTLSLYYLDSLLQLSLVHEFNLDYHHAQVDAVSRQLFVAGRNTGKLIAYHLDKDSVTWTKEGLGTAGRPYFQGLRWEKNILFAATSDGKLSGYDSHGDLDFYQNLGFSEYPVRSCLSAGRIIVAVEKVTGMNHYLNQYYYPSGAYQAGMQTSFLTEGLFVISDSQLLVAGNQDGSGVLRYYFPSQPVLSTAAAFPQETIVDVVSADAENFLIASSGSVYWFRTSTQTLFEFKAGVQAVSLDYDLTGDRLILAETASVSLFSFPDGQLLFKVNVPGAVSSCLALYNR